MKETKWDNFSTEQLQEILRNSSTFSEVQKKIGYKYHSSRNKKIRELADIYNIDISNYGSLENLEGKTFNYLKVIDYNVKESKKHHRPYWNCECKCGNIAVVSACSLKNGNIKSCGCLRYKDLTNYENEYFQPLRPTDERRNGEVVWKCICKSCHQEVELTTAQFQHQKSCGCTKILDLTGQKFGKLLAIRPTKYRKDRNVIWECKCDCGNICYMSSSSLVSGNAKSCYSGCGNTKIKVGERFGKLTVLGRDKNEQFKNIWECQCDCGKKVSVKGGYLIHGTKKSCGCLISAGNYQIQLLLDSLNLTYKPEYSFDDLKDKGKLRFDFAVFQGDSLKYVIEYNGRQHYEPIEFFGGENFFLNQIHKDSLKKEYCKKNHIPLIIFKYNDEVNVNNLLLKLKEAEENV